MNTKLPAIPFNPTPFSLREYANKLLAGPPRGMTANERAKARVTTADVAASLAGPPSGPVRVYKPCPKCGGVRDEECPHWDYEDDPREVQS